MVRFGWSRYWIRARSSLLSCPPTPLFKLHSFFPKENRMAKRVLIVDDEPRYLRLLEANLRTEGYEVTTAQDGVQALEVFSAQPIDLVLLDVMMPRLDGFATCQRIREFSNVPIVILTAGAEDQDRFVGLDLGAKDYWVN